MRARAFVSALCLLALAVAVDAKEVVFSFDPAGVMEVTSVSLRGSFNSWGETPLVKQTDGTWSVALDLEPGEYQYKYFVDGQWPADMSTFLNGGPADAAADSYVDDGYSGQNAVRIVAEGEPGAPVEAPPAPPLADGFARIHYHRVAGDYSGWGIHAWEDVAAPTQWTAPLQPSGRDPYGVFWDVKLAAGAKRFGFIVHKGDAKDPGPDLFLDLEVKGREIWLITGRNEMYTSAPDVSLLALGDLTRLRAHWVTRDLVAWRVRNTEGNVYRLHAAPDGGIALAPTGVTGGEALTLTLDPAGLPPAVVAASPHLKGCAALRLSDADAARAAALLKGQVAVSVTDAEGKLRDATGLQIPGVLDDLFAYDGPLGVNWLGDTPTLSVWAPTAKSVNLHLFDWAGAKQTSQVVPMTENAGVWSAKGAPEWKGKFYLYEVTVYFPATGRVEVNLATDPYSRSLSTNSLRSQIVDMTIAALKPDGWDFLVKPRLDAPEDIAIYELHVRDFSASDPSVPDKYKGTYEAFTLDSNGTRHLRELAKAGLTHVHLLPTFDIATINEDRSTWQRPGDLSAFGPNSEEQQNAVAKVRDFDAYNWGYDPYHYGVPEGSYAVDPEGAHRILEFRSMVNALNDLGLRTVMDVVYNHTNASGLDPKSVLDKIVPGYYHRLNADGFVETSTCCQNTATEHRMMERLMVDDLVHWARDYKVDGFRFDIMGHHMKRNLLAARAALDALTLEADGVDGKSVYLYGEGWDFGEVQGGKRGVNATQANMAGTGVGSFNDRIRDAIRGGSAFSDRREQGFATGLFCDPNGLNRGGEQDRQTLLKLTDRLKVGLAGGLKGYSFIDRNGYAARGGDGENGGYTADPQESINYCEAHDNETFFDKTQFAAAASATLEDRVRMQCLAMSLVALGQGVPFFHAGVDMLRSKSLETDSYNAGDWFNRLDFTYETNNFGVGLPSSEKNKDRWSLMRPILARTDLKPGRAEILRAVAHLREMLRIRKSSPLFRLRTADDVQARLRFLNGGPQQVPGLVVMELSDTGEGLPDLDPAVRRIVALFNASKEAVSYEAREWAKGKFELHPVLAASDDAVVKTSSFDRSRGRFTVPPRTTAVFVEP
jgi:pullulanase-type alpha-1,6-glucosidase